MGVPTRWVTGSNRHASTSARALGLSRSRCRTSSLRSRRCAASACTACSRRDAPGTTLGSSRRGKPCEFGGETATNVKYAEQQWCLAPVKGFSSSTRTPTSMDEVKVRFTMAATMTTEPTLQGRRKWTASTEAVTQGPRASVFAARPAHTSIQLRTAPPTQ